MNVSALPNRVIAVCVSIHLLAAKFYPRCSGARVMLVGNYFGLNNYVGLGWEVSGAQTVLLITLPNLASFGGGRIALFPATLDWCIT